MLPEEEMAICDVCGCEFRSSTVVKVYNPKYKVLFLCPFCGEEWEDGEE